MGVSFYRRGSNGKWQSQQSGPDIDPPVIQPQGIVTRASGVAGAGFQNAGDIHPTEPNLWIAGGDVAGVHLSADAGKSWAPNNTGLDAPNKLRTTGVRWSENPATPHIAWRWTADWNGATGNYFMRGTYDPSLGVIVRWEVVHQLPDGWASAQNGTQAGDTNASPQSGHPRQTKNRMIALDETNGVAYLGSANGLWRVNIDGSGTPTRVWGAGESVTSISLDPRNKNIAYVTVDLGTLTGVHRLTTIRTGAAPTVDSYRPLAYQYAQSCKAFVQGGVTRLVVATGRAVNAADPSDSIVYWNGAGDFASGWTDLSGNINADETAVRNRWAGVDAVLLSNGNLRILASNSYDEDGPTGKKVAWTDWSLSGVPTWDRPATSNVDPAYRIGDPSGETWWLSTPDGQPSLMLDKGGFDSPSPCIAPSNPDLWMVPGRSGVWRRDLGATDTRWFPAVKGLAVTTSWHVVVDRTNPDRVVFGDVDWTVLRSTAGMETQPMTPSRPVAGVGWNLAQSQTDGKVLLCLGHRDNNTDGYLFRSDDPWATASGSWVDELGTGSGRPWTGTADTAGVKGAAIGVDGSGTQVILAALSHTGVNVDTAKTGLFRKVGAGAAGAWSKIELPGIAAEFAVAGKEQRQHFAWQPGGGAVVWLSDPASGLWQSRDYGATWTLFYAATWSNIYSGHIVGDPTRAGVYYALTKSSEAWTITGGNGATPAKTPLCPDASTPAGIAVHPTTGNLYLAEQGSARLHKSTDGGTTWTDITTASWEAMCATVKHLTIGSNGKLYTAMYAGYAITDVE